MQTLTTAMGVTLLGLIGAVVVLALVMVVLVEVRWIAGTVREFLGKARTPGRFFPDVR
jgi:hypothetical protein